jgi:hypothetical protein
VLASVIVNGLARTEKARAASAMIRRRRKLEGMAEVLESAGYRVFRPAHDCPAHGVHPHTDHGGRCLDCGPCAAGAERREQG